MKKITLHIITEQGDFLKEEVDSLTIRLTSGYRTFLPDHLPLVGRIAYAPMHFYQNGKVFHYALFGGFLNFKVDEALLIVDGIEAAETIDLARAEAAKERALKRLALHEPGLDVRRAELALRRALSRIGTISAKRS